VLTELCLTRVLTDLCLNRVLTDLCLTRVLSDLCLTLYINCLSASNRIIRFDPDFSLLHSVLVSCVAGFV